jgi:hypothetical protein
VRTWVTGTWATGGVLFLSSFAPLLVVFGLLHSFGEGIAAYVCYGVAAGSLLALYYSFRSWRKLSVTEMKVARARPRDADVIAYVATYIIPFAALGVQTWQQRGALMGFFVLIGLLYVRANLFYVNPILALFNFKLFEVETESGKVLARDDESVVLASGGDIAVAHAVRLHFPRGNMSPRIPNTSAAAGAALASAANLGQGETQILLFSSVGVGEFDVRRINPTRNVAKRFQEIASAWAASLNDRMLVAYAAGRTPSPHELAFLGIEGNDSIQTVIRSIAEPIDVELYLPSDGAFDRKLRFYVVAARLPNPGWVYFFKAKGETLRLKRTKKVPLVPSGNAYDELAEDPLIFDETFDAVVADGFALIVNQATFERSVRFVDEAAAAATATLGELLTTVTVGNPADFLAAAGSDLNMVSKLRSIAEKMAANPAYAAAMTTEKLIEFAEERGIEIDTEEVDGTRRFVFLPDPQHRWRILKLLDDDYLHSTLTEIDYEVNSKSPL